MKFSSFALSSVTLITGVTAIPAGSPTAAAPQATESLGWAQHWIRSNSGTFLQASVPWTATDAVLGPATSAGEFNVVSTSLVDTVHTPTFLYATVEAQTAGATMLKVSFAEGDVAPASAGVFSWSGSEMALAWSRDGVTATGWLTCEDNVVYANLASATPAGCTSVTLESYQSTFAN
ncbi:hypothetical protein K439DRAFT_1633267 [Ramaria rubella]|nr:hypothetical protein K439DRAFT_1633267 [Ramaria rubella]